MTKKHIDVLIVGGGLIGASLLQALDNRGISVMLVDNHSITEEISPDFDSRSLALSPASVRILQKLAIWPLLVEAATPIDGIHVSEQGRFGSTRLQSDTPNPLGFVVEVHAIHSALKGLLNTEHILAPAQLIAFKPTGEARIKQANADEIEVVARLIVGADGANSTLRQLAGLASSVKDYQQEALVSNIGLLRSHNNWAFERFTPLGPLALLPMTDKRVSLIWALPPEQAETLCHFEEQAFLRQLQQCFGYRLGRFISAGRRSTYPLRQVIMPTSCEWPLVFIGNAAHSLHPIAGQGFNLGLRDVASLSQCIFRYGFEQSMLWHYQSMRHYDQQSVIQLTHQLVTLFKHPFPGLSWCRGLGLLAVDNVWLLKKMVMHHAQGFAGMVPELVCTEMGLE